MTSKADWEFRAQHLIQQAEYMEEKSREFRSEAQRYRGLAEQASYLARNDEGADIVLAGIQGAE